MRRVMFLVEAFGLLLLLGCSNGEAVNSAPTIRPTSGTIQTAEPPDTPTQTRTPVPTLEPVRVVFGYHVAQDILRKPEVDSQVLADVEPGEELLILGYSEQPYKAFYVETAEGVQGWLLWKLGMIPSTDDDFLAIVPTGNIPPTPRPLPRATARPIEGIVVVYEVTGSARSVDLTYENETGGTEQRQDVTLPYRKNFGVESGAFVYISAQNTGDSGTVQCRITVDGAVLETASSSGAYVIATCSGMVD